MVLLLGMAFESFGRPVAQEVNKGKENDAETELQNLLDNPENSFLTDVEFNRVAIEESDSSEEALAFAKGKIKERLDRTTRLDVLHTVEGAPVLLDVDVYALKLNVDSILKNQIEIGRGQDAFVVIDKNEVRAFPPEICYKFALTQVTPEGRNSASGEAELQGVFYEAAQELVDSKIGVPIPFYVLEMPSQKMIAMEKLAAASIKDILLGKAVLPENFDIDAFTEELKKFVEHMHSKGLYHRDLHEGNIMITQKRELEEGDKWGYVIDFGRSGHSEEGEDVYKKELMKDTFTYLDDCVMIEEVKGHLKSLKNREWQK